MSNAREWALEIDREFIAAMGDARETVLQIVTRGLSLVQERSPVAQPWNWKKPVQGYIGGQFRANWVVSLGQPDGTIVPFPGGDSDGKNFAALSEFMDAENWPVIYISNNLPYANRLEDGWSNQAPQGVVALTMLDLQAMASQGIEI